VAAIPLETPPISVVPDLIVEAVVEVPPTEAVISTLPLRFIEDVLALAVMVLPVASNLL
jgi:hypothetical protein